jgi:hypothetical protein
VRQRLLTTLLGRVAALERKLEEQKEEEEKRVKEAYNLGVMKQGQVTALVRDEIEARNRKWR